MTVLDVDVVVVGAGFAGLMAADRLSRIGYSVAIADQAQRTLAGTSSRNEGWLHAGTYHSLSVADEGEAVAVAQRCRYGWQEIQRRYPECVEVEPLRAVAIVHEHDRDRALARWGAAGVGHTELRGAALEALRADITLDGEDAFEVDDIGINTRILASGLIAELRARGTHIILGARISGTVDGAMQIATADGTRSVSYRYIVCAAGYGLPQACDDLGLPPVTLRYWRSHLVSLPRLAARSVFGVAPDQAAMINHDAWSIVGLNEDAVVVEEPTFAVHDGVASRLLDRIRSRFRTVDLDAARVTACVKVDYAPDPGQPRSLNVRTIPLATDVLALLPGKMTESPYSANAVAARVFQTLGQPEVTRRPIDDYDIETELETLSA